MGWSYNEVRHPQDALTRLWCNSGNLTPGDRLRAIIASRHVVPGTGRIRYDRAHPPSKINTGDIKQAADACAAGRRTAGRPVWAYVHWWSAARGFIVRLVGRASPRSDDWLLRWARSSTVFQHALVAGRQRAASQSRGGMRHRWWMTELVGPSLD